MENKSIGFDEFLLSVGCESKEFVENLHQDLINEGCKIGIKSAKSGYVVSYMFNKKTILNYVFRKSGLIVRIYGGHVDQYMDFLDTLPDGMIKSISEASVCKRLLDPNACNSKCSMGYDFMLKGERFKKCRNNAFMFLVCEQNNPFIKAFLVNELKSCS